MRARALEAGAGLHADGRLVRLDARERTVMGERSEDGVSRGVRESDKAMRVALDLHAAHHFTHAAAVDGSLHEQVLPHGAGVRRRLAFGVWEGVQPGATGVHEAAAAGLWGGGLPSDGEVADAEMEAIYAYLLKIVQQSPRPGAERVLILSDCKGVLDALEAAWRAGDARRLRGRDRGATLEAVCSLRKQLGRVVFLWVPAHRGISANAYADAAAKAHLESGSDDRARWRETASRARSRPCLYEVRSDYGDGGMLREVEAARVGAWVPWDRRLFPAARRRLARWTHLELRAGLSESYSIDGTFIGRRGHPSESRTYAEVARAGLKCAALDRKELDPVGRMAGDVERIGVVMTAKRGGVVGARGAQDVWWRRRYDAELKAEEPGPATREGAAGCPCCGPGVRLTRDVAVCAVCAGWTGRGRRGEACAVCGCGGGGAVGERRAESMRADGWRLVGATTPARRRRAAEQTAAPGSMMSTGGWMECAARRRRRLGPAAADSGMWQGRPAWVGFAGLSHTTVERLLRDGAGRDEDADSSRAPLAPPQQLADLRHVMGGECDGAAGAGEASDELLRTLTILEHAVARAGGVGSRLWTAVREAREYAAGTPAERAGRGSEAWQGLRRVLAYELPAPTWPLAVANGEDAETQARRELATALALALGKVVAAAGALREAWVRSAAREAKRREAMEAGRGVLRVLMRAWRETIDGVPAGAARWEGHWEEGAGGEACKLARRLQFGVRSGELLGQRGWPVRVMLAWLRLVRAGKVRHERRSNEVWRAADTQRRASRAQLSGREDAEMREAEGWGAPIIINYAHAAEAAESTASGATSGAAAVLVRRRSNAEEKGPEGIRGGRGRSVGAGRGQAGRASGGVGGGAGGRGGRGGAHDGQDSNAGMGSEAQAADGTRQAEVSNKPSDEQAAAAQASEATATLGSVSGDEDHVIKNTIRTDRALRFTERAFAMFEATIGLPGPEGIG